MHNKSTARASYIVVLLALAAWLLLSQIDRAVIAQEADKLLNPETSEALLRYRAAEARVRDSSGLLRNQTGANNLSGVNTVSDADRAALQENVTKAFEARQDLLRQELVSFRARLDRLTKTLADREREKSTIIQHRIDELLNPGLSRAAAGDSVGKGKPGAADPLVTIRENPETRIVRVRSAMAEHLATTLRELAGEETVSANKSVPINVIFAGVDRLYEDLDYLFELAKEPAHLKTLKATSDVFFDGVDVKKPAITQVYVRGGKFNMVLHAPIANAGNFRTNVRALGLRQNRMGQGLFQVKGLFEGFMKEVNGAPQQDTTTIIAEDRADLTPLGLFAAVKNQLDPEDYDLVASIVNGADLQKDRENAVELVRKQVVDVLRKNQNETDAQHALRKMTIDQQVTEIKQLYGEAELITAVANVSKKDKHAFFAAALEALPDTSLAAGIALLGKEPSYFANVPLSKTETLSGMINFKLDDMRQKHLLNFLKQARPLVHQEIEAADASSPELKTFAGPAADIIFDVLVQSATTGVLDGFVDVKVNAAKLHTMVGGVTGDGAAVTQGLIKLKEKATVEIGYAKIGEISLHKVTLPEDMPELHEIFGKESVLIVGTGTKAIWYAAGNDAEPALREAIAHTAKPATEKSNIIASLHAKASIWFKLFDALRLKTNKGNPVARKEAITALVQGEDTFDFKLQMNKDTLTSSLILNEGMLRYFGKVGAKFVKENLQN